MNRVALDASVIFHLVKPSPMKGQEEQYEVAHRLVASLQRHHELCIPTPALAEVLVAIPLQEAGKMRVHLESAFTGLAFDGEAAARTANLLRGKVFDPGTKVKAKFDAQIVGTALTWSAWLCSDDDDQIALMTAAGGTAGKPAVFLRDVEPSLFPR